ncbi:MAG: hypothetical protein HY046_06870 [Acidobacteria bacterium]|nr:hypothetical protein [Acidobacteriota bacterium]
MNKQSEWSLISFLLVVVVVLTFPTSRAWTGEPWDEEDYSKWSKKDAEKILTSSPWAKRTPTKTEKVKDKDKTVMGHDVGERNLAGGDVRDDDFATVVWWSAKTPRKAYVRLAELSGAQVSPEQAKQFIGQAMPHIFTIRVDSGPMVNLAAKLSAEELKSAAWLDSPRLNKKIAPEDAGVVMAQGKPDRIRFHFPRELDGKPTIGADEARITFSWKLPVDPKGLIKDAKQYDVIFEMKKMTAKGEVDF